MRSARPPQDRKFGCQKCDKKFFTPKDLRRHENTHLGLREHVCPSCHTRFGRKDHLTRHAKKSCSAVRAQTHHHHNHNNGRNLTNNNNNNNNNRNHNLTISLNLNNTQTHNNQQHQQPASTHLLIQPPSRQNHHQPQPAQVQQPHHPSHHHHQQQAQIQQPHHPSHHQQQQQAQNQQQHLPSHHQQQQQQQQSAAVQQRPQAHHQAQQQSTTIQQQPQALHQAQQQLSATIQQQQQQPQAHHQAQQNHLHHQPYHSSPFLEQAFNLNGCMDTAAAIDLDRCVCDYWQSARQNTNSPLQDEYARLTSTIGMDGCQYAGYSLATDYGS